MTTVTERNETFAVEDGHLVRRVIPRRGRPYKHRCPLAAFEQIAHAIEEQGDGAFTLTSLVDYERAAGRDVTFTNVAVTLAFLKERGFVDTRWRQNYAASVGAHLDAMCEYFALADHA